MWGGSYSAVGSREGVLSALLNERKGPGAFSLFFPASPINPAFYKGAPKRCKAKAKETIRWVAQTVHWRVMQPQLAQGQAHKPRQPGEGGQ